MAATAKDLALVSGLREGHPDAGVTFTERYQPRLLWLAVSAGVPPRDREDVVQETLIAGLSQIQRGLFRGECSLGRWLETIFRGKVVDYRRSSGRFVQVGDDGEDTDTGSMGAAGSNASCPNQELVLTVREILQRMPRRHRVLIILNKMADLTIDDIAARFQMPAGTVGRIIAEGKVMFREMLNEKAKKLPPSLDREQRWKMENQDLVLRRLDCVEPELGQYLTDYCFADLSEVERQAFETHLMDCDFCWREVQRLSTAVSALRFDKALMRSLSSADLSAVVGISGKLDWLWGGHRAHILTASALYATAYAVGLLTEVSYAFDRLGSAALTLAPIVFVWIFGTSTTALLLDWKSVLRNRRTGLTISLSFFGVSALLLYAALCLFLPDQPITSMRIQAYTAQAAYLKGIRYVLPLAAIFLCIPFHFVIVQQKQLREGRPGLALALLTGQKLAVTAPGTFYITVKALWVLLLAALLVSIPMTSNLFDNLQPGRYMNLFTHLIQVRWIVYFGLGLECLAWYSRALNEVKCECLVACQPSAQ